IGSVGAVGSMFVALRDLNIDGDSSVATRFETSVDRCYERVSRKGSHSYSILLADWNGGAKPHELEVSHAEDERYREGQRGAVLEHPGLLHLRWVEKFEPLP